MTHYQKLATIVFRITGLILIIYNLMLCIQSFIISLIPEFQPLSSTIKPLTLSVVLPYLFMGIILFSLSKNLAKFICFDFDKYDEQK